MAVFAGPEIVNDVLVLHLDAANPRSYPGSGTIWTDLSGNGNNGTLVNGVGYNNANNGSMVFDGVNDYVNIGQPPSLSNIGSNFSIQCYVKWNGVGNSWQGIVTKGRNTSNWYGLWVNNSQFAFGVLGGNFFSNTISANTWYYACITNGNLGRRIYINGLQSASNPTQINFDPVADLVVGFAQNTAEWFNGNISQVSIYNRALSQQEVRQNFEATRSRYGI